MADVKWIKIAVQVFDNRKIKQIEAMPDGDSIIVIWFKILCLAGNINNGGMVYFTKEIPYTEEMMATQFNRPIQTIRLALTIFQQFKMLEIEDNMLYVSSWDKYQNIQGLEKIKDQTRDRVAKHREKQKLLDSNVTCNVAVTQGNATELELDKNKIKKEKVIKTYSDNPLLNNAWIDFIDMRKKTKAPLTDRALELAQSNLDKLASSDKQRIEILNQSTMNNWKGLFAIKKDFKSNKPVIDDSSYDKKMFGYLYEDTGEGR